MASARSSAKALRLPHRISTSFLRIFLLTLAAASARSVPCGAFTLNTSDRALKAVGMNPPGEGSARVYFWNKPDPKPTWQCSNDRSALVFAMARRAADTAAEASCRSHASGYGARGFDAGSWGAGYGGDVDRAGCGGGYGAGVWLHRLRVLVT
jgi:hypothetical protein